MLAGLIEIYVPSGLVMSESFADPWTVAHQAPLSTEFFSQEYWLLLLLSRFSRVRLCVTP